MVTIRCKPPISTRPFDEFAPAQENQYLSFPTGELDFSIYRPADGRGVDLTFQGYGADGFEGQTFVLDTLEFSETTEDGVLIFDELNSNAESEGETVPVYTSRPTEPAIASQATYSNIVYFREVQAAFRRQKCPKSTYNSQLIELGALIPFLETTLIINPDDLNTATLIEIRQTLLESNASPFTIFTEELMLGVNSAFTAETFNSKFYNEVYSETDHINSAKCLKFYQDGIVPEGEILDLDVDVNQGVAITSISPTRLNGQAQLPSAAQTYAYGSESPLHFDVLSRTGTIEVASTDILRFSPDVRAKDFEIIEYNIPPGPIDFVED